MDRRLFEELVLGNKDNASLVEWKSIPSTRKAPIDVMRDWLKSAETKHPKSLPSHGTDPAPGEIGSIWFEEDDEYLCLTGDLVLTVRGYVAGDPDHMAKGLVGMYLSYCFDHAAYSGPAECDEITVIPDEDQNRLYNFYVRWNKSKITRDTIEDIPASFK